MKTPVRLLFGWVLAFTVAACGDAAETAAGAGKAHSTYVIVHGATGGGWDWKTVATLLQANGHEVYRPTLTGLGERMHLASPDVGLTTHVEDIVNLILFEDLHDIVLVGHSYGGMVITGVMDRVPGRIAHVIFLDAAAPDDGQNTLDVLGPLEPQHKVIDGLVHFAWLDATRPPPRDVPQPLKTFTDPVSYRDAAARALPVTFVVFFEGTLEERVADDGNWQRARARGWTTRSLKSDHVAERTHPRELAVLLQEALQDRNTLPAK